MIIRKEVRPDSEVYRETVTTEYGLMNHVLLIADVEKSR